MMLSCSSCDLCTSIEDSDNDDDDDIFEGSDDETFHSTKQSKEEVEDKEFLQRYPDEATIETMCEYLKLPKQSLTSFDKFGLLDHAASIYNKATKKHHQSFMTRIGRQAISKSCNKILKIKLLHYSC
jgi:hypothetical protein